ncbi:MAG TPA: hypothetical protein PK743_13980 [Luteimonas sp.]|nr:hypothetical protein [Luteimonas sp.]HRO26298.1 hypothetical protein [Luteimonas sp.]HRP73728.1 hypothetical protein [Luteimonas sp.]
MSWLGLVLLVLGAWLAYKLAGAALKLVMFALALVGGYWFAAPQLGWPTVSDLFYVFGPDFGGKRIEEVLQPGAIANGVADRVVDGVVDRVLGPPAVEPAAGGEAATPAPAPAEADAEQVRPVDID